jgi:hypothetical protein
MLSGRWSESSITKSPHLPKADPLAFSAYVTYAYRGVITCPHPVPDPDASPTDDSTTTDLYDLDKTTDPTGTRRYKSLTNLWILAHFVQDFTLANLAIDVLIALRRDTGARASIADIDAAFAATDPSSGLCRLLVDDYLLVHDHLDITDADRLRQHFEELPQAFIRELTCGWAKILRDGRVRCGTHGRDYHERVDERAVLPGRFVLEEEEEY